MKLTAFSDVGLRVMIAAELVDLVHDCIERGPALIVGRGATR